MVDIIWGNGFEVISINSFKIKVTHRKDGNKNNYSEIELVKITEADLPGLPVDQKNWTIDSLKKSIVDAFLKCEIKERNPDGELIVKVSHSGVGGY